MRNVLIRYKDVWTVLYMTEILRKRDKQNGTLKTIILYGELSLSASK